MRKRIPRASLKTRQGGEAMQPELVSKWVATIERWITLQERIEDLQGQEADMSLLQYHLAELRLELDAISAD